MAVPTERIKERLKVLYPKANLSTRRLDALADRLAKICVEDADDEAIDVTLNLANDLNPFDEIAKQDDKIRTLEAKANTQTVTKEPNPPNPIPSDDVPSLLKSLIEANQKLALDIDALKTGKITETKLQTAKSVFDGSEVLKLLNQEIKENWFKRINVDSDTPIDEQVKGLETEFTNIRQEIANNTRYSSQTPNFTQGNNGKLGEKEAKEIVDSILK